MTKNQIEYNKLLEQKRSNVRNEELTASRDLEVTRHNLAGEGIQRESLDEQRRSNLAREAETNRSNLAKEGLQRNQNEETKRANLVKESLQSRTLDETIRANQARESIQRDTLNETARANVAKEDLQSREIDLKGQSLEETKRSNLAKELEASRHNIAVETETHRGNTVKEAIDIGRAATYAADVAARALNASKDRSTKISVNPVISVSPTNSNVNRDDGNKSSDKSEGNNLVGGKEYAKKQEEPDEHVKVLQETLRRQQQANSKVWSSRPAEDRGKGFGGKYRKK